MSRQQVLISRRSDDKSSRQNGTGHSQALIRGLRLLDALATTGHPLNLSELAQMVGLAPSTTHRLLGALEQEGYVEQDPELGAWHIGVEAFRIGNAFLASRDFVAVARPFLHQMSEESGETANLGVEEDGCAVFLAQVESQQMMRMIVRLGSRAPLHASGVGKALLAWMSPRRVERILQRRGLPRLTPNTLDTPTRLTLDLARIRERGYSCDQEEHAVGLHCVAATIHDETSAPIAAVSVSGPSARITVAQMHELGGMVSRVAQEITQSLGGSMPSGTPR